MTARRRHLEAVVTAHFPAQRVVASVQVWSHAAGTRTLVMTQNGAVVGRHDIASDRAEAELAAARTKLAPAEVTEEDALAALVAYGMEPGRCSTERCEAILPPGAPWCPDCGGPTERRLRFGVVSGPGRVR